MTSFCSYLWESVYINRSGDVFACCHQKPKPFGNIYDAPLRELVNSPVALQLRSGSLRGELECYPTCNLLDKERSRPWGHEQSTIDYDSLRFLHISFGEACNIRCVMCDNPQRHRENPVLLDPQVVIRNVDLTPFTQVMLRGGEPLYIQECLDFLAHLEKVGKRYSLLTNGLLIDDNRADRLARYARDVIVSLNGATKRGHESVNKGSRFERVVENVQRIRRAREACGSDMDLGGHMTITTSNIHEVPQFLRTFRELGFDRVNFGFVKETVPLYLATHPEDASRLKDETAQAMQLVVGPNVDALRLSLLGLWIPGKPSSADLTPQLLPMLKSTSEAMNQNKETSPPEIGDPMLGLLRNLHTADRAVAFIRHSERDRARSPADVSLDQVPLTPRGHDLARRFGRELPVFSRVSVSHTSIPRSIQTATEVDAGFHERNPQVGPILSGKDSTFSVIYRGTVDKKLRDAFRVSLRGQTFTQLWLDGQVPPTVMRPATETITRFLGDMTSRIRGSPEGSLHIHIGHDREIEVVRTALWGGRLSDYPLMDFLDGLLFSSTHDGGVRVSWRGKMTDLSSAPGLQTRGA